MPRSWEDMGSSVTSLAVKQSWKIAVVIREAAETWGEVEGCPM